MTHLTKYDQIIEAENATRGSPTKGIYPLFYQNGQGCVAYRI